MKRPNALVIGTGTMGPVIAEMFALGGYRTALCGRSAESVRAGLGRARLAGRNLERFGLIRKGLACRARGLLSGATDLDGAAAGAGVIVEAIPEELRAKMGLFVRLDRAAPRDALLLTNTSGLSITRIASGVSRPGRVAGMHWWNPPHLVPLVEVVKGARTSERTVRAVVRIARALGKQPVVVRKDVPGFVANRMQYALLREAVHLVESGVASAADVDAALRAGPGLRYAAFGPLETADFIGLDVAASVMDYLIPALGRGRGRPGRMAELVRRGALGVKTGGGFYPYRGRSVERLLTERDARLAVVLKALSGIRAKKVRGGS